MLQLQLLAYEFGFLVTLHADSLLSRVKSNTVPFQGPKYDEFFERAQRITLLGVSSNFGCGIGTPLKKKNLIYWMKMTFSHIQTGSNATSFVQTMWLQMQPEHCKPLKRVPGTC
jgi:hypothetical protein